MHQLLEQSIWSTERCSELGLDVIVAGAKIFLCAGTFLKIVLSHFIIILKV